MQMGEFTIRRGSTRDLPFLRMMLFEAFYWDPGRERPTLEEGLREPKIDMLLGDWGRPGDVSWIAVDKQQRPLGALWCRLYTREEQSYGYVDARTPELGLAVSPRYRRRGIAKALLSTLLKEAQVLGMSRISLSVEKSNFALGLYESFGFRKEIDTGGAWTMIFEITYGPGAGAWEEFPQASPGLRGSRGGKSADPVGMKSDGTEAGTKDQMRR